MILEILLLPNFVDQNPLLLQSSTPELYIIFKTITILMGYNFCLEIHCTSNTLQIEPDYQNIELIENEFLSVWLANLLAIELICLHH